MLSHGYRVNEYIKYDKMSLKVILAILTFLTGVTYDAYIKYCFPPQVVKMAIFFFFSFADIHTYTKLSFQHIHTYTKYLFNTYIQTQMIFSIYTYIHKLSFQHIHTYIDTIFPIHTSIHIHTCTPIHLCLMTQVKSQNIIIYMFCIPYR